MAECIVTPTRIKDLVNNLRDSRNPEVQLAAVQQCRELLCVRNPPTVEMIACDVLPILVNCLSREDPTLQHEAARTLKIIAAGTSAQIQRVIDSGAGPALLELLKSLRDDVCEQAAWALGNIIGDDERLRDRVIELGVVKPLLTLQKPKISSTLIHKSFSAIKILCENLRVPSKVIQQIILGLKDLFMYSDIWILIETLTVISVLLEVYGFKRKQESVQMIVEYGVVHKLVPLLSHEHVEVKRRAVRVFRDVVFLTPNKTQVVLDCGALSHFPALLAHQKECVWWDSIRTLAYVTESSDFPVQAVIDAGILPVIVDLLNRNFCLQTQRNASRLFENLGRHGTSQQVSSVISSGVAPALCKLLACGDITTVHKVLDCIKAMLYKPGEDKKLVVSKIEECDGFDRIKALRSHEDSKISLKAINLVEQYDSITGRAEIKEDAEPASGIVSPKVEEYDRARPTAAVQMVVEEVRDLKELHSSTFYVRNLPWRVRAQRLDEDSFSVSLQCNWEVEDYWTCEAEWELTILSDCQPLVVRRKDKFTVDGSSATVGVIWWGQLTKGDNGFISDNSITLEVRVAAVTL